MQDSLQRIRELSVKASNGLYGDSEKQMIQGEIDQLLQDIEQTAVGTQYNEKHLLDGSMADMYIASNPSAGEGMKIQMENATLKALGLEGYNVTGSFDIGDIDRAMEKINTARSNTGASTNAMEHAYNYNKGASEQLLASRSRIEDLDVPKAVSEQKQEKLMQDYRMAMLRRKMNGGKDVWQHVKRTGRIQDYGFRCVPGRTGIIELWNSTCAVVIHDSPPRKFVRGV